MTASELSIWGDIANIVIAVASVATAIVTAIVLFKQLKIQQLEHQPNFQMERKEEQDLLIINNVGCKVSRIESVSVDRMIIVEIYRSYKSHSLTINRLLIPICFYLAPQITNKFEGVVAYVSSECVNDLYKRKNEKILELQQLLRSKLVGHDWGYVFERDLAHINYRDIYGKARSVFYCDNRMLSSKEYYQYQNKREEEIDILEINVEKIVEKVLNYDRVENI